MLKQFVALISLCMLIGCSKEEPVTSNEINELRIPLRLQTAITQNIQLSRQATHQNSGPILSSTLPAGSRVGIHLYTTAFEPYPTSELYASENICWRNTGTSNFQKWQAENANGESIFILLGNTDAQLRAYYPYDPQNTDLQTTDSHGKTVSAIALTPGTTDYLTGHNTTPVSKQNSLATVRMEHALSMISFVFTAEEAYTGNCNLQSLIVKNLPAKGLQALTDGTLTLLSETNHQTVSWYDSMQNSYRPFFDGNNHWIYFRGEKDFGLNSISPEGAFLTELSAFHLFVLPQEGVSNLAAITPWIELTIDDIVYQIPFPNDRVLNNGQKGFIWKKGLNYLYRIMITKNNVKLSYVYDDYETGGTPDFDFGY